MNVSEPAANWAALFDWDGVILDSSSHHEESWERLAAEEGLSLPVGHFKAGFGMKNELIIPRLLHWSDDPVEIRRLSLRKEFLYREVVRQRGIEPLPGVLEFLTALAENHVPCVIGSSTHRENIDTSLAALGFGKFFHDIVTAEDVNHGKPDPEVFLAAARKSGLPPERCVVFEDALVGIEAARRAGTRVVAVTSTNPAELLGEADRVVDRLDEIAISELAEWFSEMPSATR